MSGAAHSTFVSSLLRASDDFARARSLGEPVWLEELRRDALAAFAEFGLPTTRDEEWRYTNIAKLARSAAAIALPTDETSGPSLANIATLAPAMQATRRLVFVDGRLAPALSSELGDDCRSLAALRTASGEAEELRARLADPEVLKAGAFSALAAAFIDDGVRVRVPANTLLAETIHVIFVSTAAADGEALPVSHPRVSLEIAAGARASIVQEHVGLGEGARFVNATIDLRVAPNAELDHVLLQREPDGSSLVSTLDARVERDARLRCHAITLGGALVRNDLRVVLADTGAECHLNGLFFGTGARHIDNHSTVDHAMPHGTSRQLYKGILQDRARGVFRGRVNVRPDAQHTDAQQSNPNLLLSDGAEIDSKPQLEIHADDVKCSHGSTIGQIDPDALFYLRSRGLDSAAARGLLTQGFANEVIALLPHADLRERVRTEVLARLEASSPNGSERPPGASS